MRVYACVQVDITERAIHDSESERGNVYESERMGESVRERTRVRETKHLEQQASLVKPLYSVLDQLGHSRLGWNLCFGCLFSGVCVEMVVC